MKNINVLLILFFCLFYFITPLYSQTLLQPDCGDLEFTADDVERVTNGFFGIKFSTCGDCTDGACNDPDQEVLSVGKNHFAQGPFRHWLYKKNAAGVFVVVDGPLDSNIAKRTWSNRPPGIYAVILEAKVLSDIPAITFKKNSCEHRGFFIDQLAYYQSNFQVVGAPVNYLSMEQVYCPSDQIELDGSSTIGEEGYVVTICQRPFGETSGPCIRWAGSGWQNDAQVPADVDLNTIWNANWVNGFTYEVMLATYNTCSSWTAKSTYFNVGFPPEIKVNPIGNCDGQVNLSFPKLACYDAFSWEYDGEHIDFEEAEGPDFYYLYMTPNDLEASYQVTAQLQSGGISKSYNVSGNLNNAVTLPYNTPYVIDNLCPGIVKCVDLSGIECLQGFKIHSVTGGIQVIPQGTTLCVVAPLTENNIGQVTLSGISSNGPGPSVTWNINVDPSCNNAPVVSNEPRSYTIENPNLSEMIFHPQENRSINVYPNPFTDQLIFEAQHESRDNWTIVIQNSFGQVLQSMAWKKEVLEASNLPSAVYFVQVLDEQGHLVHTQKLIKQ